MAQAKSGLLADQIIQWLGYFVIIVQQQQQHGHGGMQLRRSCSWWLFWNINFAHNFTRADRSSQEYEIFPVWNVTILQILYNISRTAPQNTVYFQIFPWPRLSTTEKKNEVLFHLFHSALHSPHTNACRSRTRHWSPATSPITNDDRNGSIMEPFDPPNWEG